MRFVLLRSVLIIFTIDLLRESAVLSMAMEQHPVPQNITTFQFRLIGDMTIKQFAYLAGGAIAGYISYKLPLPFFLTWPLATLAALLGFGLAFVPIEERPMDVWILSFLRSVYSPTQFIWKQPNILETKKGGTTTPASPVVQPTVPLRHQPTSLSLRDLSQTIEISRSAHKTKTQLLILALEKIIAPLQNILSFQTTLQKPAEHNAPSSQATIVSSYKAEHSGTGLLSSLFSHHDRRAPSTPRPPHKPIHPPTSETIVIPQSTFRPSYPTTTPTQPEIQGTLAQTAPPATKSREEVLQDKIHTLEQTRHSTENTEIENLRNQLDSFRKEKEMMAKELENLKRLRHAAVNIPLAPKAQSSASTHVATPAPNQNAGIPRLTTFPNVINGIIKNTDGSLLPGQLITVRDKEGVPMRALKSNKLGQFAASTPLSNGTYIVEIEDPRNIYTFEKAEITVAGTVLPVLEIIAKSQKELTREKLAKELFGSPNT